MYDELTTDLRRAANTWLAEEYKVCAEAVRYLLREAANVIEEQGKPRWISVYDRLPPAEKEVYVTDGEYIARANLLDEVFPGDKPCWSYSGLGEITHWCEQIPLPEPPEEE